MDMGDALNIKAWKYVISLTTTNIVNPEYSYRRHGVVRVHPLANEITPATVGGKAYSLYRMSSVGLEVPHAMCLPVSLWGIWRALSEESMRPHMDSLIYCALRNLSAPALVAVRSGAAVSMPGMMDTRLNVPGEVGAVREAVEAVFKSFDSDRCQVYRRTHNIGPIGTAVIIQTMCPPPQGSGVAYSVDPVTGKGWGLFGEWLPSQYGDQLVGGTVTPEPIETLSKRHPHAYRQLLVATGRLENIWHAPVEVEFCLARDIVWFLQCRVAKIAKQHPKQYESGQGGKWLGMGLPACPGIARGKACSTKPATKDHIWLSATTTPGDYAEMTRVAGILTLAGGTTCHAAVVSRELGTPCVVGYMGEAIAPGTVIEINGSTGDVFEVIDE